MWCILVDNNKEKALVLKAPDSFSDSSVWRLVRTFAAPNSNSSTHLGGWILLQRLITRYSPAFYHIMKIVILKKKIPCRIMILFSANSIFLLMTGFTDFGRRRQEIFICFFLSQGSNTIPLPTRVSSTCVAISARAFVRREKAPFVNGFKWEFKWALISPAEHPWAAGGLIHTHTHTYDPTPPIFFFSAPCWWDPHLNTHTNTHPTAVTQLKSRQGLSTTRG